MNINSRKREETLEEKAANGYIMSDTIMPMNNAKVADAALSLKDYVFCAVINVISRTNLTTPTILFALTFCSGGLYFYFRKRYSIKNDTIINRTSNSNIITLGDLLLSTDGSYIYGLNRRMLNLTLMEYNLMKMLYHSSSHFLLK